MALGGLSKVTGSQSLAVPHLKHILRNPRVVTVACSFVETPVRELSLWQQGTGHSSGWQAPSTLAWLVLGRGQQTHLSG